MYGGGGGFDTSPSLNPKQNYPEKKMYIVIHCICIHLLIYLTVNHKPSNMKAYIYVLHVCV